LGGLGEKFAKLLYKEGSSTLASTLELRMVCDKKDLIFVFDMEFSL